MKLSDKGKQVVEHLILAIEETLHQKEKAEKEGHLALSLSLLHQVNELERTKKLFDDLREDVALDEIYQRYLSLERTLKEFEEKENQRGIDNVQSRRTALRALFEATM